MRVYTIDKARKSKRSRRCRRCGHEIQPGEQYFQWHPRYGGTGYACSQHRPRPSELTSNDKLATLYAGQEAAHDALDAWDGQNVEDVQQLLEDCAGAAQEAVELYEESISNVEQYFQGGDVLEQLREGQDAADSWQQELESVKGDLEEFDEGEAREAVEHDQLEVPRDVDLVPDWMEDHYPDLEDFKNAVDEAVNERRESWAEDVRERAREAIDSLEL